MTPRVQQLYYITHIDNVASILQMGILSHKIIEDRRVKHTPIYDINIISNRKQRLTPANLSLWDYANLYLQARNPMLYRVVCEVAAENIVVIAIDVDVHKLSGTYISVGNAASTTSEILPGSEYHKVVNLLKRVLDCRYWTEQDGSKREIMAECLVPAQVPPSYIKGIYVVSDPIADRVRRMISSEIKVIPEPQMFFYNPAQVQVTPYLVIYKGDMFFSRMHTLTVSVNTVGIMGKGLASRAKYQFPDVYVKYQDLCRRKVIQMGKPFIYKRETSLDYQLADEPDTLRNGNGATWFLLFATKRHWREDADSVAIEQGMLWLKDNYKKGGIKSLAIPALGCGLGNLKWENVGPMLCKYLSAFDIPVQLYLPAEKEIQSQHLCKEYLLSGH